MTVALALIGNPNSGKTSLFNALTGDNRTVGNWAGVTVRLEQGSFIYENQAMELIDLPGIYSLATPAPEQKAVAGYLQNHQPDVLINVVDSTNLARNLYLTSQLAEAGLPLVVALNMEDELKRQGLALDAKALSRLLGLPCVKISAARGSGLQLLLKTALQVAKQPYLGQGAGLAPLYSPELRQFVSLPPTGQAALGGNDWQRRLSAERYRAIGQIIPQVLKKAPYARAAAWGQRLDKVLCHRVLAFPIFLLMMLLVFYLSFGPLGSGALSLSAQLLQRLLPEALAAGLSRAGAGPLLSGLLVDGLIRGAGAVLVFLPQLMLLFLFLALLEASGYLARAAFITDKALSRLGLSGMSFIPLMLGFGCTVPAMLSCRLLENRGQQRLTMLILPFMSCSARLPVYAMIAGAFFPDRKWLVISSLYLLGILAAILTALLFRPFLLRQEQAFFALELPPYRKPAWRAPWRSVWRRSWDFITHAGSVLLLASLIVWLLSNFGPDLRPVAGQQDSLLFTLGQWLTPLFAPLGFGRWQLSVALLSGFFSKESVVSTLSVLYSALTDLALPTLISPAGAGAFLVFVLLYTPCLATVATARRESGSWRFTLLLMAYQFAAAWVISFFTFRLLTAII